VAPLLRLARALSSSRAPTGSLTTGSAGARRGVDQGHGAGLALLLLVGLVVSRFFERVLLLAAALRFAGAELREGALLSLAVASLSTSRGLLRSPLLGQIRRQFAKKVAVGLFLPAAPTGDPAELPAAARPRETLLLDGLWATELAVGTYLPSLVADGAAAVVVVVYAIVGPQLSPSLLLAAAALFLVVLGAGEALRRWAAQATEASYQAFVPFATWLGEAVQGADELRANGREAAIGLGLTERAERWARAAVKADWLAGFAGRVPFAVGFVGLLLALLLKQRSEGVPDGQAIADALVAVSVLPPFAAVAASIVGLMQETPKARVLDELLRRDVEEGPTEAIRFPLTVKATDLTFRYPGGARVALACPRLDWSAGELLAIAGPNGAGKSTLLKLLAGVLADEGARQTGSSSSSGKLTFNDVAAAGLDRAALARETAYVAQRPYFPAGATVREALHWFVEAVDGPDVGRAEATWLQALDEVSLLARLRDADEADPLAVVVDELSGGERKRLALARASLRVPKLAFFDEPDGSLDAEGLALLPGFLRRLRDKGTMVAFVAHRPEILAIADRVVSLDRPGPDNATRATS
jgi:ABC-type transport system involved in cytochrome bd biosynthesis fused ATPase/permease subunit